MQNLNTGKYNSSFTGPLFSIDDESAYQRSGIALQPQRSMQKKQVKLPFNGNTVRYPQLESQQPTASLDRLYLDVSEASEQVESSNSLFISIKNKSGTQSPPPPALSPASPSSVNSSNFNSSSRASPAPPVIVDEDGQPSSFQLGIHRLPCHTSNAPPRLTSSLDNNLDTSTFKLFEKRACLPALSSVGTSDSTTSSSSSTISSIEETELRLQAKTNGIPILEKISVSLSASKCDGKTKLSPLLLQNFRDISQFTKCDNIPQQSPKLEANQLNTSNKISHNLISNSVIETTLSPITVDKSEGNIFSNFTKENCANPPIAKKRKQPAKRKRTVKKPWTRDSDSEYESKNRSASHRTSGKVSIVKRITESAKRTSASNNSKNSNSESQSNVHGNMNELAFRRRYLESPFFCLCQSPVEPIDNQSREFNNTEFSSNVPSHIINPALRDYTSADSRLASSCPILQQNSLSNKLPFGKLIKQNDTSLSELQSYFHNSSYKPTLRSSIRDPRIPSTYCESDCDSWCCVFCNKKSDFLSLGPLYGPYFLSDTTREKLFHNSPESSDSICTPIPTPHTVGKKSFPGIVTSAVTRSAAAQTRPSAENSGCLRLVIKAISPPEPTPVSALRKKSDVPCLNIGQSVELQSANCRVSRDGEVWLHFECVLWAPGTFIRGDGKIGGLDDAVSMALNAMCSNCNEPGAILSCISRGCELRYHFCCAKISDCHFNNEQLTILCKKHFVYS